MKREDFELLAPAGDLEKLKIAIIYGADAVYFGGEMFSVVPLSLKDWGVIIGLSSLVLWIGEIARGISRLIRK